MRVTDRQIREVIASLQSEVGRVTGARTRAELARRYGARGGVARVYRILAEVQGNATSREFAELVQRVADLERRLEQALRRAELAEHREVAHQDWAATQIFALRERLREADQSPRPQGVPHEDYLQVHRALAAARVQIAALQADRTEGRLGDVTSNASGPPPIR